ncbi:MAG: hypothetical protein AAF892_03850 [Cyanobacteria bacterium P01_D01_bin.71]
MVSKVGFDFDEFGGNVDAVIVKGDKDQLENSVYLNSFQGDWHFDQQKGQEWSFYNGMIYPADGVEALAQGLSKEFLTKAIYFYFSDASGWMGYQLFINGEASEEYSFGVDYDEELAEAGINLSERRKVGTVVASNENGYQCLFWSLIRTKTEDEVSGGEKFIDEFLQNESAYIGWDLFSNS